MKNEIITLNNAEIDSVYYINKIYGFKKQQLCRLYDLGIVANSKICPLFTSAFKGTTAYLIKGSVISLRNEDAQKILVSNRR